MTNMYCFSCKEVKTFTDDDSEGPVCECGHWQTSESSGAAEICLVATWHDLDAYKQIAELARAGGFEIPDVPNNFQP